MISTVWSTSSGGINDMSVGSAIPVSPLLTLEYRSTLAYRAYGLMKESPMPKEIFPSSFECDCGHQSDFFENTVREMKAMSQKKKVYLADAAPEEHTIVFYRGKMVATNLAKTSFTPVRK